MTTHQTAQHIASLLRVATDLINGIDPDSMKDFEFNNLIEPSMKDLMQAYSGLTKVEKKTLKHPIDTLLKKGKIKLSDGRYKQLVQIYDHLMIVLGSAAMPPHGLTFLSAKQNDHITWFPLDLNGDKSAALYLMAEWEIAPLKPKDNGVLTGQWEDFDLNQAMEDSEFDQDDY